MRERERGRERERETSDSRERERERERSGLYQDIVIFSLHRGSYGTVYECVHNTTQQTYAAKLLPLDVGRDHAQHELEMLARVSHPNIVQMMSAYLTHQHFVLLFQL